LSESTPSSRTIARQVLRPWPAPPGGRRCLAPWPAGAGIVAALLLGVALLSGAQERHYTVAFANLTEEPGVTIEGTGFTGRDVRQSFELAARRYPIDVVFYDNQRDGAKALANAADAIGRRVDLYIQYQHDRSINRAVGEKLRSAGIPVLAVNDPVPGAPLYTADNRVAGRIAGETLAKFATSTWRGQAAVAVLLGHLTDQANRLPERTQGVREAFAQSLPTIGITALDTQGNLAQVGPLLGKFLSTHPAAKVLVATMDDTTALVAKTALEAAGRIADAAIVSQGCDRSVHGGVSDRKEIDPNNRGTVLIGSVAFYLDRYGYEILPLAMRILQGQSVPPLTATPHRLITAANVWREYPPYDMQ
jgi:ribose transport system substrate-binding protein